MADVRLTRRQTQKVFGIPSGAKTVFQFQPLQVGVLEVRDTHFHTDSAVLIPEFDRAFGQTEENPTGLEVLRACLLHAREHPTEKLLISGHTDTMGAAAYNLKLSALRCRGVYHALLGEKDPWVRIAMDRHVVLDYQVILRWLSLYWWWDTDPIELDGTHGAHTERALRRFKETYNEVMDGKLPVNGSMDKATWEAFFEMYVETLCDGLETDREGIKEFRSALTFLDPNRARVACGEHFPIEGADRDNFRSETNRRVELLFFTPDDPPKLLCHPDAESCVPAECEIHRRHIFRKTPIRIPPPPLIPVTTKITQILGLYKPGHPDPVDTAAGTKRAAGYLEAYRSEDDRGRIYLNHIPRADTSVEWQTVWKKDTQYIELTVTLDPPRPKWPRYTSVYWDWSDPDDPSNATMRKDAAAEIDSNDFQAGLPQTATGGDNVGQCDFPKPDSGPAPKWAEIAPYGLTLMPGGQIARTLVRDGVSRIRLHLTNAGGDNFKVGVQLWQMLRLTAGGKDTTGVMTMWKRIDVEQRWTEGAVEVPFAKIPPFFEPAFIQLDFAAPLPFQDLSDKEAAKVENNVGTFTNEGKPGWFYLATTGGPAELDDMAKSPVPRRLYRGPAEIKQKDFANGDRGEILIIPALLAEEPQEIHIITATGKTAFVVGSLAQNSPRAGHSTVQISANDYHSDFVPGDGLVGSSGRGGAYDRSVYYYPTSQVDLPGNRRSGPGYGLGNAVTVAVYTAGLRGVGGFSPDYTVRGKSYFAGRTVITTENPHYHKPAEALVTFGGTFKARDIVTATLSGHDISVTLRTDQDRFAAAGELAEMINAHPFIGPVVGAVPLEENLRLRARRAGVQGNGISLTASTTSVTGSVQASGEALLGGGPNPDGMIKTIVHEFGHAFGFPHKCGYHSFEDPAETACCMNYSIMWLYAPGTRTVQPGVTGKQNGNFCPRHLLGLRRVQLERNPALWKW